MIAQFINHPRTALVMIYLGPFLTYGASLAGEVFWTSIYAFCTCAWMFRAWEHVRQGKAK